MRGSKIIIAGAVVALAMILAGVIPISVAREMPPPEVGATVVDDPLIRPAALRASFSATGRNSEQFTDEGFRIKVTGKATETSTAANYGSYVQGLTFTDGETRVDLSFAGDLAGSQLQLHFRVQPDGGDRYYASLQPARGLAQLRRVTSNRGAVLAERSDLGDLLAPDDWNSLAVRAKGPNFWLLLNDEPILSAVDSAFDTGRVYVGLYRTGDVNDERETSVVLRNLRVSALAIEDQARAPVYEPPALPASPAFVPPVGTPPEVGAVVVEDPLVGSRFLPTEACRSGRGSSEYADEGMILRVRGKCTETACIAAVETEIPGLTIPDGELRLEMKAVSAPERARITVFTRSYDYVNSYAQSLALGGSSAGIGKTVDGPSTTLAFRTDVGRLVKPDDWNRLAVRMEGPNLWLIVNDQPVLSAADPDYETGGVQLRLSRIGDPDDEEETAVVVRNLRVSALVDGDPSRAPTHHRPSPRPGIALTPEPDVRADRPLPRRDQGAAGIADDDDRPESLDDQRWR